MSKISIDIGSRFLHVAEGDYQKGQLTVQNSQSFEIPSNCLDAETVIDGQLLADTVSNALKAGEFRAKEAILTINATHAIIREIDLPKAKPKELDSMIKNEMHQTFHVLNTDIIQYKEIGKAADSDGAALDRYRAAAIDKDFVEGYYQVLERTGLKAAAMDINVNAIDKLLGWTDTLNQTKIEDKGVMLIDFGHSITTVYIYSKEQPLFYRHLNIGSAEIDNLLMSTFYKQETEAKNFKEKLNFFDQSEDTALYFDALKPFFYHMNDEVRKLSTFYINRSKSTSIGNCFLFGQGSQMLGFPEYWSTGLNLPTEKLVSVGRAGSVVTVKNPAHFNAIAALIRNQK